MCGPSSRQRQVAVVAVLSGMVAAAIHALGGTAVEQATGVFVGVTVAATLGVLYIHGQTRGGDHPNEGDDADDETKRKQKAMEAEAGGYGGNAGH